MVQFKKILVKYNKPVLFRNIEDETLIRIANFKIISSRKFDTAKYTYVLDIETVHDYFLKNKDNSCKKIAEVFNIPLRTAQIIISTTFKK